MSNTVYPLCAACCLKFRLPRPQRWGMASSDWLHGPWVLTLILTVHTLIHTVNAQIHKQHCRAFAADEWTCIHTPMYAQTSSRKNIHKRALMVLTSTEKISFPQKSLSNSYSSVVLRLSGSKASLGIDCQAYCLYQLSVISQKESTSMLGETHALRFPFNLTGIEVER